MAIGPIITAGLLCVLVVAGTALFRPLAQFCSLLDTPNHRSAHGIPVPRGAGIVFIVLWLLTVFLRWLPENSLLPVSGLLMTVSLVALVGFADDLFRVRVGIRLLLHALIAMAAVICLGGVSSISLLGTLDIPAGAVTGMLGVLGLVWLLNLYNFMDGTDGLAAGEALFVSLVGSAVLWHAGSNEYAFWMLCLGACMVGFLRWNLPAATVFMGDSGSSFLGFLFGGVALLTHNSGVLNLWFWLILLGVFTVDATVTLVRKVTHGKGYAEAHRTHAYQHAARRYASHGAVLVRVLTINVVWLLPIALLAYRFPAHGFVLCLVAYAPLFALAWYFDAGVETDD